MYTRSNETALKTNYTVICCTGKSNLISTEKKQNYCLRAGNISLRLDSRNDDGKCSIPRRTFLFSLLFTPRPHLFSPVPFLLYFFLFFFEIPIGLILAPQTVITRRAFSVYLRRQFFSIISYVRIYIYIYVYVHLVRRPSVEPVSRQNCCRRVYAARKENRSPSVDDPLHQLHQQRDLPGPSARPEASDTSTSEFKNN